MAPTVRAVSSGDSGGNATTLSVDLPTHVAGDLLVVALVQDNPAAGDNATFSLSGWTFLYNTVTYSGDQTFTFGLAYKVAGASETTPVSVTSDNEERLLYVAWSVQDGDSIDVYAATPAEGDGTSASFPSITTTQADTLAFAVVAADAGTGTHSAPSGYSAVAQHVLLSGGNLSAWSKALASAGSETPGASSWATAQEWVSVAFAVAGSGAATIYASRIESGLAVYEPAVSGGGASPSTIAASRIESGLVVYLPHVGTAAEATVANRLRLLLNGA